MIPALRITAPCSSRPTTRSSILSAATAISCYRLACPCCGLVGPVPRPPFAAHRKLMVVLPKISEQRASCCELLTETGVLHRIRRHRVYA